MVRVEGVPAGGLREGNGVTTEMRFFAFLYGEVLERDPPRVSTIRLTGLLEATVTSTIEPLAGDRSLLERSSTTGSEAVRGEIVARSLARMGGRTWRFGTRRSRRSATSRCATGRNGRRTPTSRDPLRVA